jgi:hypothetical protein
LVLIPALVVGIVTAAFLVGTNQLSAPALAACTAAHQQCEASGENTFVCFDQMKDCERGAQAGIYDLWFILALVTAAPLIPLLVHFVLWCFGMTYRQTNGTSPNV